MGRKKSKAKDTVPLDTPSEVIAAAQPLLDELLDFCRVNGVTAIVSLGVYDRLLEKETRHHDTVGSTSSVIGLLRLAENEVALIAMDEDEETLEELE